MTQLDEISEFGPSEMQRMGPSDLSKGLALMKIQQMDGRRGEMAGELAHAPSPVVTRRVK